MTIARGIRNCNPGNIIDGSWTQGRPGYAGGDGHFAIFATMPDGIAALVALLVSYHKRGFDTIREVINRWAPSSDGNDVQAYINAVCAGWILPDEQLPYGRDTFLFLAQRITRHECGPDVSMITPEDWSRGLAQAGFPAPEIATETPVPAPPAASAPPVATTPSPQEKTMPAPFLIAAAQMLLPLVADLFRGHGGATATRNADLVEQVGEPLVAIAKTLTGTDTEQQAAQRIVADPILTTQFREAVAADLDRLVGVIARTSQIDDESRDRAAARAAAEKVDFAPTLIQHQFWMLGALSAATVVAMLAAVMLKAPNEVLVGLVVLFTGLVNSTATKWATILEYRFGSSSGSQAKDAILAGVKKN
jgi:hypothetical protein